MHWHGEWEKGTYALVLEKQPIHWYGKTNLCISMGKGTYSLGWERGLNAAIVMDLHIAIEQENYLRSCLTHRCIA